MEAGLNVAMHQGEAQGWVVGGAGIECQVTVWV